MDYWVIRSIEDANKFWDHDHQEWNYPLILYTEQMRLDYDIPIRAFWQKYSYYQNHEMGAWVIAHKKDPSLFWNERELQWSTNGQYSTYTTPDHSLLVGTSDIAVWQLHAVDHLPGQPPSIVIKTEPAINYDACHPSYGLF